MGPMVPNEMKYNLNYGDVRGDVLPQPQENHRRTSKEELQLRRRLGKLVEKLLMVRVKPYPEI